MYAWDAHPAIDSYLYRASNSGAEATVDRGDGRFVDLPDGQRVLQLYPSCALPKLFLVDNQQRYEQSRIRIVELSQSVLRA